MIFLLTGYMKNRTTARKILINQIKRITRQICQKENNLHQNLICEQRRCYDTEAEHNLAIIQRDFAEEVIDRIVGDL